MQNGPEYRSEELLEWKARLAVHEMLGVDSFAKHCLGKLRSLVKEMKELFGGQDGPARMLPARMKQQQELLNLQEENYMKATSTSRGPSDRGPAVAGLGLSDGGAGQRRRGIAVQTDKQESGEDYKLFRQIRERFGTWHCIAYSPLWGGFSSRGTGYEKNLCDVFAEARKFGDWNDYQPFSHSVEAFDFVEQAGADNDLLQHMGPNEILIAENARLREETERLREELRKTLETDPHAHD